MESTIYISKYSSSGIFWNLIHFDEKPSLSWFPGFEADFLNYCLDGLIRNLSWLIRLFSASFPVEAVLKSTRETSATILLILRKELQISSQLFVVLWVSDDVNKTTKLETFNLVDFK